MDQTRLEHSAQTGVGLKDIRIFRGVRDKVGLQIAVQLQCPRALQFIAQGAKQHVALQQLFLGRRIGFRATRRGGSARQRDQDHRGYRQVAQVGVQRLFRLLTRAVQC